MGAALKIRDDRSATVLRMLARRERDGRAFAISSGSGTVDAEDLYLFTYDTNKDDIDYVQLDAYTPGGALASNTWYEVSIPFSALGSDDTTIGGFYIQTADASATIYVDAVEFVADGTGTTTTYGYDHAGSRVFKGDGTATTTYANKYYDTDGSVTTKHIYAGGEVVATVEDDGSTVTVNTVHTDHLGGTNVVSDSNGNLEQLLSYYPFGATRIDEKESVFNEKRRFTGHELDDETGLYYMQARYQDPEVGRFASQDPVFWEASSNAWLSDPQQQNSYSYAANNPIKYNDPDGEAAVLALPLVAAVSAAWKALVATAALAGTTYLATNIADSLDEVHVTVEAGPNIHMMYPSGPEDPNEFKQPSKNSSRRNKVAYGLLLGGAAVYELGGELYERYRSYKNGGTKASNTVNNPAQRSYGCLNCSTSISSPSYNQQTGSRNNYISAPSSSSNKGNTSYKLSSPGNASKPSSGKTNWSAVRTAVKLYYESGGI